MHGNNVYTGLDLFRNRLFMSRLPDHVRLCSW